MKKLLILAIASSLIANSLQAELTDKGVEAIKNALRQMNTAFNKYIKLDSKTFKETSTKDIGCDLLGAVFKGSGNIFNIGLIFAQDFVTDEEDFEILTGAVGAITPLLNKALFNKIGCTKPPQKTKEQIAKEVEELSGVDLPA